MLLYLTIIAFLGAIICFQQYVIQDKRTEYTRLNNYTTDVLHYYLPIIKQHYSKRQRDMEKAYRAQLKRVYKKREADLILGHDRIGVVKNLDRMAYCRKKADGIRRYSAFYKAKELARVFNYSARKYTPLP